MDSQSNVKSNLFYSGLLIIIGVLAPILSLTVDYRPDGENFSTWFQRSGSVLVLFTVFAELNLTSLYSTILPGNHTIVDPGTYTEKYKNIYIVLTYLAALLAIAGTIIWGYGDLIIIAIEDGFI